MTKPIPDRPWLHDGAKVVVYDAGRGISPTARPATVKKVYKQYVLTEAGQKFRLTDLTLIGDRDAWSSAKVLVSLDDPRVRAADRRARTRNARYELVTVIDGNRLRDDDPAELLRQVEAIRDAATAAATKLMRLADEQAQADQEEKGGRQ